MKERMVFVNLLINASNLYVGGGVQVAISVLEELTKSKTKYLAAISPVVAKQLSKTTLDNCIVINKTPSKIFNFSIRKLLDDIVIKYKITHVFTVFGPSYWTPKNVKHSVGFALPWLIYDTHHVFNKLSFREKIKKILLSRLQPYFYKKNADLIFVETNDVRERLVKKYSFSESRVVTVNNTLNEILKDDECHDDTILKKLPFKKEGDVYLLTISHDYPHKNLSVIPELIELLPEKYKFIVTLDSELADKVSVNNKHRFINVGPVCLNQCPALYKYSDALFLPTLLECFSGSYLEAMYFNKVILTSNLSFAHVICKDSAIYFNPYSISDIAEKIKLGFENHNQILKCQQIATLLIREFPTASERMSLYLDNIENL